MAETAWYGALAKPFFAPPASLFAPVWSVLYVLIIVAAVLLLLKWRRDAVPTSLVLLFAANLIANLLYTPLQFGLHSNGLALLDVLIIFGTLAWFEYRIRVYSRPIFYLLVPYLLWVAFAVVLQISVTALNPSFFF